MRKIILCTVLLSLVTLGGCATRKHDIVIDPKGVDMGNYSQDLAECKQISRQVDSKVGKRAVGGAIIGGVAGEIIGNKNSTKNGAKLGALGGGLRGAAATKRERTRVVKNCLRRRGYAVLN